MRFLPTEKFEAMNSPESRQRLQLVVSHNFAGGVFDGPLALSAVPFTCSRSQGASIPATGRIVLVLADPLA
jgi:hypothetical protein